MSQPGPGEIDSDKPIMHHENNQINTVTTLNVCHSHKVKGKALDLVDTNQVVTITRFH